MVNTVQTSEDLSFIKGGRLNIVAVRKNNNKETEQVNFEPGFLLTNEATVRSSTMDAVLFNPNVVFKVTLDFKRALPCLPGSSREAADWVLLTAMGSTALFNKTEERLLLQMCEVRTLTNVKNMQHPVQIVLAWDEDEWVVERVFR